jgi:hypothetical protein
MVGGGDLLARIIELRAPIVAGTPSGAFEDEAEAGGLGDGDVALIITHERCAHGPVTKGVERGKVGQLQAFVEYEGGLNAPSVRNSPPQSCGRCRRAVLMGSQPS